MTLEFIRYGYIEKKRTVASCVIRWLPKCLIKRWYLNKRRLRRKECEEGELKGMEVTVPFFEALEKKLGKKMIWNFLEQEIQNQKKQSIGVAVLLQGSLFSLYCEVEHTVSCYPYELHYCKIKESDGACVLFQTKDTIQWLKHFFIKELTEYYRVLYGIRKKVLKIVIVEKEVEETKRVVRLLSKELNYMVVKTDHQEEYEDLAREIYEEHGLSIVFLGKEATKEEEVFAMLQEQEVQKTILVVDLMNLYQSANHIRVTQRGIWVDQEVLVAFLMERAMNFEGKIIQERLEECKNQYGFMIRKIR